jgi:hypothetical protein
LLQEALVRAVYAAVGQDELSDFSHPSVGPFEVFSSAAGYRVAGRGAEVEVHTYAMLDFGDVTLHCTVLRSRQAGGARGGCPRCGTPLRSSGIGGAYRTIATERVECPLCQVQVLGLRSASSTLGALDSSGGGDGWVRVVSTMVCPQCGQAMQPATFTVGETRVSVEACRPCERVLLEPEDRRALEVAVEA